MRLAAVLLVSSLMIAASAQAATVRYANDSPEEITKYWTKERMRSAKPRELAKGGNGGDKGGKPGGGDTTTTWSRIAVPTVEGDYTGNDLNNGKVFFTLDGVNYVCSGTSVAASASVDLVWTAGHCVTDGIDHEASRFIFVPGYIDGNAPYGEWAFQKLGSTPGWIDDGDFEYDFGAARVVPGEGVPEGATLDTHVPATPRSMAFGSDPKNLYASEFNSYGYPAAGKFNGQRMYMCDSPVLYRDASAMGIGCDMTGGSSGGGWVIPGTNTLGSVNSYHYRSLKNVMFGPYQGSAAQTLYDSMD